MSPITICWSLYDRRDRVVAGGEVTTPKLKEGVEFKATDYDFEFEPEDGEKYYLVVESVRD